MVYTRITAFLLSPQRIRASLFTPFDRIDIYV
ncbi:hypothetical protein STM14_5160 [Salmonella enterica subsp. enterica serovar Typhimurium str. 14028S]|uniref:Uncharacterized protein n=1 Tax=Salmonella typhimurium (strain 14028s / SGSC 2262) TaxID=588858 RepID=A0A0F6BAE7_SALT1|nr:hypothetical protein STM14_5160 [Salmonella enterica subsp. enterica serovar Typhimurium str. 14028S]